VRCVSNLADAVFEHAHEDRTRGAVRAGDLAVTYGDLRDLVASYAGRATAAGIRPGDRVVLIAPTGAEFVAAYYGLHAAGAVLITMNVMATAPEIDYVLEDADASLVVAWHESAAAAASASQGRGLPLWTLPPLGQWSHDAPLAAPVDRADDDTAIIIYTSGTTGRPKGAELSVGGIFALVDAARQQLHLDPATDRTGTALPLFHVYGQLMVMHISISLGAPVSLLHPFDPGRMIAMIRDHRLTVVSGVPAMWIAMLHAAGDATPADFTELRLASSGGASLPGEVIRAFQDRFGTRIREGYGLSETSGWATSTPPDQEPKIGAVGRAVHGMQLEVRDPYGEPVPAGEVGEVWVKGPIVMKGYWRRPEATAEAIRDGWLRTGDLGTLDEDGDLRIVDRLKEMIIRGGYNVYPREVEEVLYQHPDIVEAAVIGVPDPTYGEEVAAVIVLRDGAGLSTEELRAWAKEQLSAYKVPHLVQVLPALPKGPSGKILKRAIDRDRLRAHGGPEQLRRP
jgi:long-chain acyl-CoA synthetase